jgi:hypothetical protein
LDVGNPKGLLAANILMSAKEAWLEKNITRQVFWFNTDGEFLPIAKPISFRGRFKTKR